MKRKISILILLMIFLSACGAESLDPCGEYADDMGSDLIIRAADGGGYMVDYSIYKLAYMDNAEGVFDADSKTLSFEGTDYNGNILAASVDFSGVNPIVTLTKSSYSDCPAGTVFEFRQK